ncbi:MAG TPA: hypothetical protein VF269_08570 [Rhodanobacteraceae bacterium]
MFKLVLAVAAMTLATTAYAAPQTTPNGHLLLNRVQQEQGMHLPTRGMTRAEVLHRYGKPLRKLQPRGGDTKLHPVIYRWEYARYIVYFEYDHVIHTVLNTPAGNNRHPQKVH